MSADINDKTAAFKASVEAKLQSLVSEFAEGKLSREQFHAIYQRYSTQLSIANQAMASGNDEAVSAAQGGPPTVAMRDALMGKAVGLVIYHHRSGTLLETLGNFEVPVLKISPILNDFSMMLDAGKHVDHRIEKMDEKQWLVFTPGRFTTIVTLFRHEPSQMQCRELDRLHQDFERANRTLFNADRVKTEELAFPFLVFVRQKIKK